MKQGEKELSLLFDQTQTLISDFYLDREHFPF